jgi:dipeptidase
VVEPATLFYLGKSFLVIRLMAAPETIFGVVYLSSGFNTAPFFVPFCIAMR